jgi:hypothetical protein
MQQPLFKNQTLSNLKINYYSLITILKLSKMNKIIKSFILLSAYFFVININAQADANCIGVRSKKPCNSIPDNVCGCDGNTYANPCAAEAAGVLKFTKGPCRTLPIKVDTRIIKEKVDCIGKRSGRPCNSIPDNVCGCDGVTYINSCAAAAAGVTTFTNGPCNGTPPAKGGDDCFEAPNPNISINCINLFDPVCGCDGKEYPNDCFARAAGVKRFVKGKCNQNNGGNNNGGHNGGNNNGHTNTPTAGCGTIYHHITTQPSDFYSPACKVNVEMYPVVNPTDKVINPEEVKGRIILAKDILLTEKEKCNEGSFCIPTIGSSPSNDAASISVIQAFKDANFKVSENGDFDIRTPKGRFLGGGEFAKPNAKNEIWGSCIYNKQNYAVRLTWIKGQVDNRNNFEVK